MRTITSAATQMNTADFLESAADNLPDNPLAQSALETTRDAIARWTGGIHLPRMLVPGMVRVSPQARWYAQANNGFQEWLSQGGFAQGYDGDTVQVNNTDCAGQAVLDIDCAERNVERLRMVDADSSDACID
ncbi:hypothetical protein CR152_14525 [Massilia violaceinigra]|uniref:Uncharacterized protein n=1 Tax=Massilia violaceinigra TaxID=2045208 RepID=A0A2D2DKW5_9BURK|nr:hypothetical protein [Massilia violaceinigra]ATQ75602.1 hypothetical protein CR152_14525 [Massilia violaceinigra]